MAINVTAAGGTGTHSFAKTNVNTEEDYIYFRNTAPDVIPPAFVPGTTFLYSAGAGQLGGLDNGDLLYVTNISPKKLTFSETSGGEPVNLTSAVAGGVNFNTPTIYENKLNIDASTANNQAVKYYTNSTPLTGLTVGETYFLKNISISDFAGSQSLYSFTSHTFTTCGVTGRVGPTQAQMRTEYTTSWDETYLTQGDYQGYQDWVVPVSGVYGFTATGAAGYNGTGAGSAGRGAVVSGRVSLTKGEIITIAVGQVGAVSSNSTLVGGSGGATWVVRKSGNEPLFVAGGGSGDASTTSGKDAVMTKLGGPPTLTTQISGTVEGQGGFASGGWSGGGGGFLTRGVDGRFGSGNLASSGGGSFSDGLTISTNARQGGYGGFGGGAQADSQQQTQSGGGGGYSGGAGSRTVTALHVGGGGGIFITPTANTVGTSTGTYNGSSTFSGVAITNLNAWGTSTTGGSVAVTLVSSFTTGNSIHPTAVDAANGTNTIAIEAAGSSFHSLVPINFDLSNNQVHSPTPHTLTDGEAVTFQFSGTTPAGIANSIIYYVNVLSIYTYKLSTTPLPTFALIDFTTPTSRDVTSNSRLSRVVVNTVTNTLTIPNHGFLVDQPLQYNTNGGVAIEPLQDLVTYYVAEVVNANQIRLKTSLNSPNPISLVAAGVGTGHSFIFLTVNLLEDTLYLPNHGLVSGQAVTYSDGGGTVVGGLSNSATYYVIRVDASIIRLSSNRSLTPVANLTTVGSGTHSLTITSLDFATDTITLPNHGFLQGELIEYDSKGNDEVAGLTTATPYYVIFVDGDNIKLATTPENAIEGTAVNITAAGVGIHSLRSLSKTPDGIYTISSTSAKSFTCLASGNVPLLVKTFNPRATLNLIENAFNIESHGFITGTRLAYSQGESATDISGLVNETNYFVIGINKDYFRLATTAAGAAAGIPLVVSDFGTGIAHSFTTTQINGNITGGGNVSVGAGSVLVNGNGTSFSKILKVGDKFRLFPPNTTKSVTFAAADVNTTSNIITKANTFITGETVIFSTGGGVAPAPLVNDYYYFVRAVSATEITLHNTQSDAVNSLNAIDITTEGTGTAFALTNVVPVGPIIRSITAIGSDTQITVDRPYASAYTEIAYTYPTFVYVRPEGYSLHRPFDGGVEMSVGAGTSLGQIIRQTRKYFRYQSGKGIQTSAGLNFKPSIDLESMTRQSATTIQCRTRRPHGLISGLFIIVSQATDSDGDVSNIYNGTFQVTVTDLTTFTVTSSAEVPEGDESRAFGFPQFHVREWTGGAIRSGMFDFQNGMFFEFDGQKLYAVRRSSTQQMAGTVSCLQGSEQVFGTGTAFEAQLDVGDFIVLRGQTYRVADIDTANGNGDTRMTIRPEYKGSSGTEKEFDPGNGTTGVIRLETDTVALVGHGFADGIPVVYNSIDGEPIGGLINGRTYYVDLVNNNSFKLKATPESEVDVNLSSVGTTSVHSFTPAKSGIIVTKTVDTRIPQEDWSIDPCDGTGPTGFNLDISRIQMVYIDYSWYGAGKIRFGFKTTNGQVQYVHEFVHNNQLFESYFRSGNLPGRYEVVTFQNPTYIPFLFHWGTSVMMDGRFDDDRAYLFTATSQSLNVPGTTTKSFGSGGINLTTDLFTVQTHGFNTGDIVQFQSVAPNGLPGDNVQNPATEIVGSNSSPNLTNSASYGVFVNSPNLIHLTPLGAKLTLASEQLVISAQEATVVTITTEQPHELTNGMYVGVYGSSRVSNGPYTVTRVTDNQFTYTVATGPKVRVNISTAALTSNIATIVTASAHGYVAGDIVVIAGATNSVYNGTYTVLTAPTATSFTYARTNATITLAASAGTASISVPSGTDTGALISEIINFTNQGNTQYTYFLYPEGSLNNTSGPNYQPLISLRLSPSVSSGLTGKLGDRDIINRMQLRLREVGISTNELVDVKLLLNARLNNLNFQGVDSPSLVQIVEHTSADTVSGGVQVYNFRASGTDGAEQSTVVDVEELFELSNSILGGDSTFPDGPDIITVAVSRLTGQDTITGAKLSWTEAQA
jgi:hypothetical protein